MQLRGARVLVTGASTGIGAALAVALGAKGATVALVARRKALLDDVLDAARQAGAGADSCVLGVDLGVSAAAERAAVEVWDRWGGVDALVSNAAVSSRHTAPHLPYAEVERVMRINFLGPASMACALAPRMVERGVGALVFVGSIAGRLPSGGEAAYVASKYALAGFTETLAVDLAGSGVDVRLVTPGPFDTAIWDAGDAEPSHYTGPKYPPAVAADAIVTVLEGVDRVETFVPADIASTVHMKNNDLDAWVTIAVDMVKQADERRREAGQTVAT
jgi:short-subunit dehydrogenase